jgi:hypothetical protein
LLLYYLFSLALLLGLYCTVCIIFVSPCIQYLHVIFCDETGWRLAVLNFVICCMREQLCYVIIICICHYIVFATDVYARPPWVLFSPCIQYLSMSFSAMKLEEIGCTKFCYLLHAGIMCLATTVQYVIIIICIYSTVHRFCYRQPELYVLDHDDDDALYLIHGLRMPTKLILK